MDKARRQTDKILNGMKHEIGRIYESDPALIRIQREYDNYMSMVQKRTEESYNKYMKETDQDKKAELKKIYTDEVKDLTINSAQYKKLVKRITSVMADVNQRALNICNKNMAEIYAINYNQVAVDCRKVGIRVDG